MGGDSVYHCLYHRFLDGYIARKRKEVTIFGSVIDPVADKLLVSAACCSLMDLGMLAGWMVMLIIGREFAVSGLRVVLLRIT